MCYIKFIRLLIILFISNPSFANADENTILVTFKPLHSIISNITHNAVKTQLLLTQSNSPHYISLKPSHLIKIQNANLVFYLDKNFETFMRPILKKNSFHKKFISLSEVKIDFLFNNDQTDFHFWLSPKIVIKILPYIVQKLEIQFPQYKNVFSKNKIAFEHQLIELDKKITNLLYPYKDKNFIVAHDAFQYYENAYKLKKVMALSKLPQYQISGLKMNSLINILNKKKDIRCLFMDPNKIVEDKLSLFLKKYSIDVFTLDPIGKNLVSGKNLYEKLLLDITNKFLSCLKK